MLDIDHHLIARQMRRQRTVIAGRASAMGSGVGAISRFGRLLSRPMLSNGLFLILKPELELFNCQLFGVRRSINSRSLSFSAYKSRSICCSTAGSFGNASASICTPQ